MLKILKIRDSDVARTKRAIERVAPISKRGISRNDIENAINKQKGRYIAYSKETRDSYFKIPPRIRVGLTYTLHGKTPKEIKSIDFINYVRNVVPNEVNSSWDEEAIRSISVAIICYALYNTVIYTDKYHDYDVLDSTRDQWYKNKTETPKIISGIMGKCICDSNTKAFETRHDNRTENNFKGSGILNHSGSEKLAFKDKKNYLDILKYYYSNTVNGDIKTIECKIEEISPQKIFPTQEIGNKNKYVKILQEILGKLGFYTGNVDGNFGSMIKQSVIEFQKKHDLKPDGIVGPKTWSKLKEYL